MCAQVQPNAFASLGRARIHGCMSSKRGSKRSNESTQAPPGQLDIRKCLKLTKAESEHIDACHSLNEQACATSVSSKPGVISHVGQIIAAACNDHRVKDVSDKKRMHEDWCRMATRCARRPHVLSGHDVAPHDTHRKLYDGLNNAQKEAVRSPCSHALVILAGAGTGKTTTLLARIEYLLDNGAHPENVLVLTFSNKSAQDIVERLVPSLGLSVARRLVCTTIHSFCWALIRCFYHRLDLQHIPGVARTSDRTRIVKEAYRWSQLQQECALCTKWLDLPCITITWEEVFSEFEMLDVT